MRAPCLLRERKASGSYVFFAPRLSRPGLLIKRIAVRWKKHKNAPAVTLVDVIMHTAMIHVTWINNLFSSCILVNIYDVYTYCYILDLAI